MNNKQVISLACPWWHGKSGVPQLSELLHVSRDVENEKSLEITICTCLCNRLSVCTRSFITAQLMRGTALHASAPGESNSSCPPLSCWKAALERQHFLLLSHTRLRLCPGTSQSHQPGSIPHRLKEETQPRPVSCFCA